MATIYTDLETLLAYRFHVKQRKLAHQQKVQSQLGGSHHVLRKGRGMDFSEVRQYQAGDDVRHIDWRVSARTQTVHTKVFTEEIERPVVFVLEQSSSLFFGSQIRFKTAQALNVMSLLAWPVLNQKDRVGSLIFGDHDFVWQGPKHHQKNLVQSFHQAIRLQHRLKQPKAPKPENWTQHLSHLMRHLKPGNKIFLIGDCLQWQTDHIAQLRYLKKHHAITAIHIYDELEVALPKVRSARLSNGVDEIEFSRQRQQTLNRYKQTYLDQMDALQSQLNQLKIPLAQISAQADPLKTLMTLGLLR